jgi:uncharacterized lipoprotein YmbA
MKRRLVLISSCAALLTGCTSAPVHSWRIASVTGQARGGTGTRIAVRGIGLPGAMSPSGVPAPGGAYAADTFPNDLWAAPLATMLQTAMVENLAQRLPADIVLADGGAIGAAPDQLVEIQVLAFTPDASGNIILSAQLAARPATKQDWQLQSFTATKAGGQAAETIAATMSMLWGEAADRLASMLA